MTSRARRRILPDGCDGDVPARESGPLHGGGRLSAVCPFAVRSLPGMSSQAANFNLYGNWSEPRVHRGRLELLDDRDPVERAAAAAEAAGLNSIPAEWAVSAGPIAEVTGERYFSTADWAASHVGENGRSHRTAALIESIERAGTRRRGLLARFRR